MISACDICDVEVVDPFEDLVEDDGIYRCESCDQKARRLKKQFPQYFGA